MQWKNSHLSRGVGYIPWVWTRTIIDDMHRLCSRSCYHSRSSHRDHLFLARYGKDGTAPDWLDSFAILPNLFPELALHQWPSALQADALLTELSGIGETFFRESLVTKTRHTKKGKSQNESIQLSPILQVGIEPTPCCASEFHSTTAALPVSFWRKSRSFDAPYQVESLQYIRHPALPLLIFWDSCLLHSL